MTFIILLIMLNCFFPYFTIAIQAMDQYNGFSLTFYFGCEKVNTKARSGSVNKRFIVFLVLIITQITAGYTLK
jgi:hypothetical protein